MEDEDYMSVTFSINGKEINVSGNRNELISEDGQLRELLEKYGYKCLNDSFKEYFSKDPNIGWIETVLKFCDIVGLDHPVTKEIILMNVYREICDKEPYFSIVDWLYKKNLINQIKDLSKEIKILLEILIDNRMYNIRVSDREGYIVINDSGRVITNY